MVATLKQIEQEVARRSGPFSVQSVASATVTTIVVTALTSSITMGGIKNLTVLRRGKTTAGAAVPGFVATDRQRAIKDYDPLTGLITVERNYITQPIANEEIELHHLDPANELRPAVQGGLWRCYFVDRASVTVTGAASERDLGALASWITDPSAVFGVGWSYPNNLVVSAQLQWWDTFNKSGSVWLAAAPDAYPNVLLVTARRPHATYVKPSGGAYGVSTVGPTADDDEVSCDLRYAAAAGHIEAWRLSRPRMAPPAAAGLAVTQQEAADEFTRMAALHYNPPPAVVKLSRPYPSTSGMMLGSVAGP